jgi:hypothetical protein
MRFDKTRRSPAVRLWEQLPMMVGRLAVLVLMPLWLAGCADNYVPKSEPSFYRNLAQPGAQLDAAAAASMISGYRANNGLPAVELDSDLMRLAQAQAEVMAKRDKLDHGAGKPFVQRLKASGYDAKRAAENISAGYHTLAEAFSGWRDSNPHPYRHCRGLHARLKIQGVLGNDHRRTRRQDGIADRGPLDPLGDEHLVAIIFPSGRLYGT